MNFEISPIYRHLQRAVKHQTFRNARVRNLSSNVDFATQAKSMDQKRAWTSRLKELMLKNFGVSIPEHVQKLVMQLGEAQKGMRLDGMKTFIP